MFFVRHFEDDKFLRDLNIIERMKFNFVENQTKLVANCVSVKFKELYPNINLELYVYTHKEESKSGRGRRTKTHIIPIGEVIAIVDRNSICPYDFCAFDQFNIARDEEDELDLQSFHKYEGDSNHVKKYYPAQDRREDIKSVGIDCNPKYTDLYQLSVFYSDMVYELEDKITN